MTFSSQALAADLSAGYSTEDSTARAAVSGSSGKADGTEAAGGSLHSQGGPNCGDDNYRCTAVGKHTSIALHPVMVKGPCFQKISITCGLTALVRLCINLCLYLICNLYLIPDSLGKCGYCVSCQLTASNSFCALLHSLHLEQHSSNRNVPLLVRE